MFCHECGNKIEAGWKFCTKCGTAVDNSAPSNEAASNMIPGKKYTPVKFIDYVDDKMELFWRNSDFHTSRPYVMGQFIVLEDGTQLGFGPGLILKYRHLENDTINNWNDKNLLYRLDVDGTVTFLNSAAEDTIDDFYAMDGFVYFECSNELIKVSIN